MIRYTGNQFISGIQLILQYIICVFKKENKPTYSDAFQSLIQIIINIDSGWDFVVHLWILYIAPYLSWWSRISHFNKHCTKSPTNLAPWFILVCDPKIFEFFHLGQHFTSILYGTIHYFLSEYHGLRVSDPPRKLCTWLYTYGLEIRQN